MQKTFEDKRPRPSVAIGVSLKMSMRYCFNKKSPNVNSLYIRRFMIIDFRHKTGSSMFIKRIVQHHIAEHIDNAACRRNGRNLTDVKRRRYFHNIHSADPWSGNKPQKL